MVSDRIPSNVPPAPSIDLFPIWRPIFERKMRERPGLQKRFFKLIEAGCDKDDLERALWWVVLNFHISKSATPKEMHDFFALAEQLLPQLEKLRPNLEILLNWRSQNKLAPGFDILLEFLDHLFPHLRIPQQRSRILTIPGLLDHLDALIKAVLGIYKIDTRTIAAHAASVPEVLLFEYLKRATPSTAEEEILDQIGEFVELAFEAYWVKGLHERVHKLREGREVEVIDKGREYEAQSWGRRYRRFKETDPEMPELIVRIVEEFLRQKSGGGKITLVRFFIDSYSAAVRSLALKRESSDPVRSDEPPSRSN
jgi:hypothetical protein